MWRKRSRTVYRWCYRWKNRNGLIHKTITITQNSCKINEKGFEKKFKINLFFLKTNTYTYYSSLNKCINVLNYYINTIFDMQNEKDYFGHYNEF